MFPELFRIPFTNLPLSTYGVLLAIAFMAGLWIAARTAKQDGLDQGRVYDLGLYVLLASLAGSKLMMIATDWDQFRGNISMLWSLDFLRSGGVFYGGFLGAVIASIFLIKKMKLPWWKTADAFAPGIALGQAVGRLGCFSAGCCWGKPTTSWLGVHFTERAHELTGVPTIVAHLEGAERDLWSSRLDSFTAALHLQPTQLYEAFATGALFVLLWWWRRRRKFEGQIILLYALLYAAIRFLIEFLRDDPRGDIFGVTTLARLSTSQIVAILVAGISIFFLRRRAKEAATHS